ncbi:MAG: hypothetical protein GW839_13675 [Flavobacteriales bacterium]|nr:hypothetical protein [Flavobacteriales bacterium]NCP61332.1 hypothetical protein [Flavobacteriales bacterium]NCP83333.1 hypothetical protein [Bacteroidota bacterium]PIV93527.1 MAG: hypothetical protein COW44_09025 [Flavobacteriaceae bacterium CG17_big_fil_post_rev_8_21_14_2_50_33_15]PJB18817.1 MAG: hypothetical protein CO117_06975 [Flavobacteriaceae bacterium CG_4_9_14_3_um_filter_33_16]
MIKLFRNIRKQLLEQGKTTNYLKYAIGEIILVVIGILIALQINSINQAYRDKNTEKAVISDFKKSLVNTKRQFEQLSLSYQNNLEQMDFILNHLKSRLPCTDELKKKWISVESYPEPLFEIGIYENFKNISLHLIQNDSLKTSIIQFYEAQLPSIGNKLTNNIESISTTVLIPLNAQNFTYGDGMMTPNDYERLLDNQQYLNAVSYLRGIKSFVLKEIKQSNERLILLIAEVSTYQNKLE